MCVLGSYSTPLTTSLSFVQVIGSSGSTSAIFGLLAGSPKSTTFGYHGPNTPMILGFTSGPTRSLPRKYLSHTRAKSSTAALAKLSIGSCQPGLVGLTTQKSERKASSIGPASSECL